MNLLHRVAYRVLRSYWWVRRPITLGVKGVLLDGDGRVLLVRHTYQPGWHLPGGGVKKWESLADAAIREVWEETGHQVSDASPEVFGVYANFSEYKSDHVAVFLFRQWQVLPDAPKSPEISEFGFFSVSSLPEGTTAATQRRLRELLGAEPKTRVW
ncbi:MAG: NUDIX domain-containing protein [Proteobacteria bacterium]|nr:NUDIX domain-containing protein [Pseudomonadota bacterium]